MLGDGRIEGHGVSQALLPQGLRPGHGRLAGARVLWRVGRLPILLRHSRHGVQASGGRGVPLTTALPWRRPEDIHD